MDDNNAFGKRLRKLREGKGLRQEDMYNVVGYGKSAISQWETGTHVPGIKVLVKLADYFDVPLDYLVGRTDNPKLRQNDRPRSKPEAKVAEEGEFYSTDNLEGIMVLVASAEGREELKPISPELRSRIINAIKEAKRDRQEAIAKGEWPPVK